MTGAAKRKGAFAPDRLGGTEFLDYSLQQVRNKDSHKGKPKKSRAKSKGVPRPKIPSKIMRTLRRYPHEPIAGTLPISSPQCCIPPVRSHCAILC